MSNFIVDILRHRVAMNLRSSTALSCLLIGLAMPAAVHAQSVLTWDNDGNDDDDIIVNDGDWQLTAPPPFRAWQPNGDNENVDFANGDIAVFRAPTTPLAGAFAVDVQIVEDIQPSELRFKTDGYTISDDGVGRLNFGTNPLEIGVATSGDTATISAPLVGTADIEVNNGSNAGTLVLSGNNVFATGELAVNGGQVEIEGNYGGAIAVADDDATLVVTSGTITGAVGVDEDATLKVDGGEIDGVVTIAADANAEVNGGQFDGTVGIAADATVDVNGGQFGALVTNNGGTVTVGDATFSLGVLVTDGDLTIDAGTATITAGAALTNTGGTVAIEGGQTLAGNLVSDDAGSRTTNDGTLNGTVGLSAGRFTNADGDVAGLTTVNGGRLEANGGDFSGGVVITSGIVNFNADTAGDVTNNGLDTLEIEDGITIDGSFTQQAGQTNVEGTLDGTVAVTGGVLVNRSTGEITDAVTATAGTVRANGGAFDEIILSDTAVLDLNADTTADITNGTVANAGISIEIEDGLTVTGNVISGNATSVTTNDGTIDGDLNVTAGLVNATNGSTVTGTTTITGGIVTSTGATFADGGVTQDVNVSTGGTFNASAGTTTANVVSDNGTVTIATGRRLDGNVELNDANNDDAVGGITTSDGTITGNVLIDEGTFVANAASVVEGNVDLQEGTFTANGTSVIEGTLDVDGGTFTAGAGSSVEDAATVAGGILEADGGSFDNGLTITSGTLNINADTAADITNNGSTTLNIANPRIVTGDFTQQAGTTTNAGTLSGDVDVTGGTLTHNLNGVITGDVAISGGELVANGGTITGPNDIDVTGGTLTIAANTAASVLNRGNSGGGGTVQVNTGIVLDGDLDNTNNNATTNVDGQIDGDLGISNGDVTLTANAGTGIVGGLGVTGDVNASSGSLTIDGGAVGGDIFLSGDADLISNVDLNSNIENDGTELNLLAGLTVTGNVTTLDGETNNAGIISGDVTVSEVDGTEDSSFTNQSGGSIVGDVTLSAGSLNNAAGAAIRDDIVSVSGGELNANGGTFRNAADTATGTVDVSSTGILDVNADTTVNVISADGTTVRADAQITGTVVNAGSLVNNDTITGTVTNTGTVQANGVFNAEIQNNGGSVTVVGDTTADVDNTGGDLTVEAGTTLTGAVNNNLAASDVVVETGAEITGAVTLSAGSVENDGRIASAVISGGEFENNRRIAGAVTLSDGTFSDDDGLVSGVITQTGGILNANDSRFDQTVANNGGVMNVTGTVRADVDSDGGDLNILAASTLDGSVSIEDAASTVDNEGTVTGDVLIVAGQFTGSGNVEGDVQLGGTTGPLPAGASAAPSSTTNATVLDATNGTFAGLVTNNGGTIIADNSTFSGGILNGMGDVNVNGATTGDVDNAGGTLFVNDTLTGDVSVTAGFVENDGTIAGEVTIDGGTVEQDAGSDTTGLTRLNAGGTLEANGGSFSGGILTTGGTLDITANTTGDIRNNGATIEVPGGLVLTGDLTNRSGTTDLNGTVSGELTVDAGDVNTVAASNVTGTTTLEGGALNAAGGTFDGRITANGGTLTVSGDVEAGGNVTNAGGDIVITTAGDLTTGNVNQSDGTTTVDGTLTGHLTTSGGTAANNGSVTGDINIRGGDVTTASGSSVGGVTNLTGGTLTVDGGLFTGRITNDGGAVDVVGAMTGSVTNTNGTLDLSTSASVIGGNVTNAATLTSDGGTITGALTNSGTADLDGDLTVGSFTNSGTIAVTDGATFTTNAAGVIAEGGTLSIDGATVAGSLTAQADAILSFNNAVIDGSLTSSSAFTLDGDLSVTDDLRLRDDISVLLRGGDLSVTDRLTIDSGSDVRLQTGTALTAGQTNNAGTIRAAGVTTIGGLLDNSGTFNVADAGAVSAQVTFDGAVTNSGTINGRGSLIFTSGLDNTGTLDLTGNEATTDRVTISGAGLSGDGNLRFDLDLAGEAASADRITLTSGAFVTGEVNLSFNLLGSGGEQDVDLILIDIADDDPGNFTLTPVDIVDPSGILTYSLARNAAGDVIIEDGLNPGIAGLAGNIVLTQSLIGSVVNRPSSPFVSGLAYEDEDPCGYGMWGRAIGGVADSTGSVTQGGEEGRAFDGTISADYAGIQLGGDYACFNGAVNGWDLAVGGILGVNTGSTSQPVFAINTESDSNFSGLRTSTTTVDFDQFYAGAYATAVKGPIAVDLQYRLETTEFSATNVGATLNGVQLPGLGLNNTTFGSEASTLSGAISYFYNIPETELTFVPTAGFSYTQISTDPINFADRGVVQIDDFDSQIGFVGGTLARSRFGDDGVSATRQFMSATVYSDFADGPESIFTPADDSGDRTLTSENLGTYGELSAGVNYVRILQPGEFGDVKQVSASGRLDVRFSDRLDSYGLTGQLRFQF